MELKISKEQIKGILKNCFADSSMASVNPFTSGYINKMYEIKLKNGKECLLRVFNEQWKAKKEAFIYGDIRAHVDIPIPEIFYVDDSMKIIPYAYTIMSKIKGMQIDDAYRKYKDKKIFEKAGEILAKIHKIKFHRFGWIVGNEIKPAFERWRDFVWHDVELKLTNLKEIDKLKGMIGDIENYLNQKSYLLDIKEMPSLLHKDYHCSHIIADKNEIKGIVDVEWAIAGHTENDFIKMELWAFNRIKNVRDAFFTGYLKYGHISDDYPERRRIYEMWHWINMANISFELKDKKKMDYSIDALNNFLKRELK